MKWKIEVRVVVLACPSSLIGHGCCASFLTKNWSKNMREWIKFWDKFYLEYLGNAILRNIEIEISFGYQLIRRTVTNLDWMIYVSSTGFDSLVQESSLWLLHTFISSIGSAITFYHSNYLGPEPDIYLHITIQIVVIVTSGLLLIMMWWVGSGSFKVGPLEQWQFRFNCVQI